MTGEYDQDPRGRTGSLAIQNHNLIHYTAILETWILKQYIKVEPDISSVTQRTVTQAGSNSGDAAKLQDVPFEVVV